MLKKIWKNMVIFGLTLIVGITGCNQDMPVQSNNETGLQFVTFASQGASLQKVASKTKSALITKAAGGKIVNKFNGANSSKPEWQDIFAKARLDIPPYALNEDMEISLTTYAAAFVGDLNFDFAPHGLVFNTPVILNIYATGFDFSQYTAEEIAQFRYYYDNQETGQWELMECDDLYIDAETGTLILTNAKLPHFSRYAVAWAN